MFKVHSGQGIENKNKTSEIPYCSHQYDLDKKNLEEIVHAGKDFWSKRDTPAFLLRVQTCTTT